ncbi:hypothetical protein TNCV_2763011 [Trichonephila clavipes]|nr:hypothetical protein TNCV_2763011 [Trichonephila clavipes]
MKGEKQLTDIPTDSTLKSKLKPEQYLNFRLKIHAECTETQSQVTGGRKRAVNWSSNLGMTAGYLTPGFIAGSATGGLLATDLVILNHSQVMRVIPGLASPLLASTQRGRLSLNRTAAVAEWYRYRTVACFVTGSSPVPLKDPPCRAAMHVKSVES